MWSGRMALLQDGDISVEVVYSPRLIWRLLACNESIRGTLKGIESETRKRMGDIDKMDSPKDIIQVLHLVKEIWKWGGRGNYMK